MAERINLNGEEGRLTNGGEGGRKQRRRRRAAKATGESEDHRRTKGEGEAEAAQTKRRRRAEAKASSGGAMGFVRGMGTRVEAAAEAYEKVTGGRQS